ncbi:MAG: transketolase [Thermoplasmata archaeon]|nr:transketolase [Thermoplasmata archaeon]
MTDLDTTCVNTLRFLAVDSVEKAKSGHPGLPLGAAPMAYVLWDRFLRHNPADPNWPNRDRFILSAGHGSALLYALLHVTGYDLPLEELQRFRQWGSRTPGHPEHGLTPGVEATTGPLGQGFAMGVGMAIAERHLAAALNTDGVALVDHHTYGIVSDGDLMEGISSEAASLAGTLGLGKLIYLYDDNHISLEGPTEWAFTESVPERFGAYGWHVLTVPDGNDLEAIGVALTEARADRRRPTLICVRTHIGFGSPVQDTREAHGEPLGPANLKATKEKLGWPLEPTFRFPDEARAHFRLALDRGAHWQAEWETVRNAFRSSDPLRAERWEGQWAGRLPPGWDSAIPTFGPSTGPMATRDASQKFLDAVGPTLPALLGGAADLSPSTKTLLSGSSDYSARDGGGRNFHFGVREHAMVAILNGMALHGGLIPYGGTFLTFSDYARGALRLAALQQTHVVFVFTHDSIGMGEDGPTHQPVEHVVSLRAIPHLRVIRPADANETTAAWRAALERKGPTALVFTRQKLPVLDPAKYPIAIGVPRGGYVLSEAEGGTPRVILIATGSEVSLALDAQQRLQSMAVPTRVVSFPSWELFEEQSESYRMAMLPPAIPKVSIEAGVTLGWARYVGPDGASIGVDRFGASAPGPVVQREYGFTVEHIVEVVQPLLAKRGGGSRP